MAMESGAVIRTAAQFLCQVPCAPNDQDFVMVDDPKPEN
jgi:hypothetical protein